MARLFTKPSDGDPVDALPNLGPKSAAWLSEVGIHTISELREIGAVDAYRRLKQWNPRLVSLNALYAIHAALEGMPWQAVDAETKARLRADASF